MQQGDNALCSVCSSVTVCLSGRLPPCVFIFDVASVSKEIMHLIVSVYPSVSLFVCLLAFQHSHQSNKAVCVCNHGTYVDNFAEAVNRLLTCLISMRVHFRIKHTSTCPRVIRGFFRTTGLNKFASTTYFWGKIKPMCKHPSLEK